MADDGMRLSEQNVSADGAEAFALSPCWDAIDAVVCINLDARKDRWESFCNTLRGKLPQEKLHRVSAVVGRELPGYGEAPWFTERTGERSSYWAGVAGCTLSHAKALRMAQQQGWRNVLIFEDDIEADITSEGLRMLEYALRSISGKYLLYLGYSECRCGVCLCREGAASFWQIEGALAAHSYLVPQSMYAPLLAALPKGAEDVWAWVARHRAVDTFYQYEVPWWQGVRAYAVLPLMFKQNGMSSDLVDTPAQLHPGEGNAPRELRGAARVIRALLAPLRRLKIYLNSVRTHRRAVTGGFPGFRKNRPRP